MYKNSKLYEIFLSIPSLVWLTTFFLIPTLIIFAYAFKPTDPYGGIGEGWTFSTFEAILNPNYYLLIWQTIWLSLLTTLICLCLALPVSYHLANLPAKMRNVLLLMIVVPFWSSFLIRIFAWKSLLHPEGPLQKLLVNLHLVAPNTTLLYNSSAVLLVMVYSYLPFAVFPIYAAASKFNFQLIEAALDLGASRMTAFRKVFIPGISKGILTALVMVFIPAFGTYVITDLVGGASNEMIGNKIAQKTFVERNLPQASALSALIGFGILIPLLAVTLFSVRNRSYQLEIRNRE
jgi:spermidine/putrescine transport system permease protein